MRTARRERGPVELRVDRAELAPLLLRELETSIGLHEADPQTFTERRVLRGARRRLDGLLAGETVQVRALLVRRLGVPVPAEWTLVDVAADGRVSRGRG